MTTIKPAFPYYGAKGRMAGGIAALLPAHRAYVEPFAGSAAVLLAKPPSYYEVLNDLDGEVLNFWRILRDRCEELTHTLQLTPYSRAEYLFCRDAEPAEDPVERARRFFVRACLAFNASTAKVGFTASHPRKAPKAATFAKRVDERLAQVAERIRGVELENTDALSVIKRWDQPGTVLYLDPPYLDTTRVSTGDYQSDNGGVAFHTRLVEALLEFQGSVILSGYKDTLYDDALNGAPWARIDQEVYASTSSHGTASRRTECLWVNFTVN